MDIEMGVSQLLDLTFCECQDVLHKKSQVPIYFRFHWSLRMRRKKLHNVKSKISEKMLNKSTYLLIEKT